MKNLIKCLSISLGFIAALCIIDCKPANAALVKLSPQHFYTWAQKGNKANLEKYKRYINIADKNQNTALCLAQQAKDRKAYSLLLDYNASPNVPCHDDDDKVCAVIIGEKLKVSPAGLLVLGAGAFAAGAYLAIEDGSSGEKCNLEEYPLDNCPANGVCSVCGIKLRLDGCENDHRPNADNTACLCDSSQGYYDNENTCKLANNGYECAEQANGCYKKDRESQCPAGYSTQYQNVNNCGAHPEGWTFDENGMSGELKCGKCTAKTPDIFVPDPENPNPEFPSCNTDCATAQTGVVVNKTLVGYFGDTACYSCSYSCGADTYATENECGNGGFGCDSSTQGGTTCWYRNGTEIPCGSGFTADLKDCSTKAHPEGWTWSQDTVTPMSGNKVCGKCTEKTPDIFVPDPENPTPDFPSCNTDCTTAQTGVVVDKKLVGYFGDTACYSCTYSCGTNTYASENECTNGGYGCNSSTQGGNTCWYRNGTETPCGTGFTAGLEDCSTKAHPEGWTWSQDTVTPMSGNKVCGKCTEKTPGTFVPDPENPNPEFPSCNTSCSTAQTGVVVDKKLVGYFGDTACYSCTYSCDANTYASEDECTNGGFGCDKSTQGGNTCWYRNGKEVPCGSGFTAGLEDCSSKAHPEGWTWIQDTIAPMSGGKKCGKCTEKLINCPTNTTANACVTSKFLASSTVDSYAGDTVCYACEYSCSTASGYAETCPAGKECTTETTPDGKTCYNVTDLKCPADAAFTSQEDCQKDGYICSENATGSGCWKQDSIAQCPSNTSLTCEAAKTGFVLAQTGSGSFSGGKECQICTYNCATGYFDTEAACKAEGDKTGMSCESVSQGGKICYNVSSSTAADCPAGYTTEAQDVSQCGTTGRWGYTLDDSGKLSNGQKCTKCVANTTCPEGSSTSITGPLTCPVIDGLTAKFVKTTVSLGENHCGTCTYTCNETTAFEDRTTCLEGGWNCYAEIKSTMKGNVTCQYRREAQACTGVFSTEYQSVNDCGEIASGWTWSQDTVTPLSGGKKCGYCQANSCPANHSTDIKSVNDCKSNSGLKSSFVIGTTYSGDELCNSCSYACNETTAFTDQTTCQNSNGGGWNCTLQNISIDNQNISCYVATEGKTCNSGYSTNIQTASDCGAQGSNGWKIEQDTALPVSGGKECNKCVALPCNGESQTKYADINECPNTFATLKVSGHSESNYAGDQLCYNCTYSCANGDGGKEAYSSLSACELGGYNCKETSEKNITCYAREGITVCNAGYSTQYQSVSDCGTKGATGWTWSQDTDVPMSSGLKCGKCTEKTPSIFTPDPGGTTPEFPNCNTRCADPLPGIKVFKTSTGFYGDHECFVCHYNCGDDSFPSQAQCENSGYSCNSSTPPGTSTSCWYKTETPLTCETGYTADLEDCSDKAHPEGWTWSQDTVTPIAGNKVCGKCTPKQETCPTKTTANSCTASPFLATSNIDSYAGDTACYTCTYTCEAAKEFPQNFADSCPEGRVCTSVQTPDGKTCYQTNVTSCPSDYPYTSKESCEDQGWTCSENVTGANCWKHESAKACETGYTAGLEDCSHRAHPEGWTWSQDTVTPMSGSQKCGKCTAIATSCPEGSYLGFCPSQGNYSSQNNGIHSYIGDNVCYSCTFSCDKGWESSCPAGKECDSETIPDGQICYHTSQATCPSGYVDMPLEACEDGGFVCEESAPNSGCTRKTGEVEACPVVDGVQTRTSCGTSGEEGWFITKTGKYSGGQECLSCEAKPCNAPYSQTNPSNCGTKTGLVLDVDLSSYTYAGDNRCYMCNWKCDTTEGYFNDMTSCTDSGYNCNKQTVITPIGGAAFIECYVRSSSCPTGYTAGLENCSGKAHPDGWDYEENGKIIKQGIEYTCGRCVEKTVENCLTDVSLCGTYPQYSFTITPDGRYQGDAACGICTPTCNEENGYYETMSACETGSDGTKYTCTQQVGPKNCYIRKGEACPTGYDANLTSAEQCGTTGSKGYHLDTVSTSDGTTCGQCVVNSCSTNSTPTSVSQCGAGVNETATIGDRTDSYTGETPCKQCIYGCKYADKAACESANEGYYCQETYYDHGVFGDNTCWAKGDAIPCPEGSQNRECGYYPHIQTISIEVGLSGEQICYSCSYSCNPISRSYDSEDECLRSSSSPSCVKYTAPSGTVCYVGVNSGTETNYCPTSHPDTTSCSYEPGFKTTQNSVDNNGYTCYACSYSCDTEANFATSCPSGKVCQSVTSPDGKLTCYNINEQTMSCPSDYNFTSESSCVEGGWKCEESATGSGCWKQVAELTCPAGYSKDLKSVTDCGAQGANGWDFFSQTTEDGLQCGRCFAHPCDTDTSTAYTTASSCPPVSGLKASSVTGANYSGEQMCYSCNYTCEYTTQSACNLATGTICKTKTVNGTTCYVIGNTCPSESTCNANKVTGTTCIQDLSGCWYSRDLSSTANCYDSMTECHQTHDTAVCIYDTSVGKYCKTSISRHCESTQGEYSTQQQAISACPVGYTYNTSTQCYQCSSITIKTCPEGTTLNCRNYSGYTTRREFTGATVDNEDCLICHYRCDNSTYYSSQETCNTSTGTNCVPVQEAPDEVTGSMEDCYKAGEPISTPTCEYNSIIECENDNAGLLCKVSEDGCSVPDRTKLCVIGTYTSMAECENSCSGTCSGEAGSCYTCSVEGCDSSKGEYNSASECNEATGLMCQANSNGCYTIIKVALCEYTSRAACNLNCKFGTCESSGDECWSCKINTYTDSNCNGECSTGYTCATYITSSDGSTTYYCKEASCSNPGTGEYTSATECSNACGGASCPKNMENNCYVCANLPAMPSGCYTSCSSCQNNAYKDFLVDGSTCQEQHVSNGNLTATYCCALAHATTLNSEALTSSGDEDIVGMESDEDITNGSAEFGDISLASTTSNPTNISNITIIHNSTGNAYGMRGLADNTLINEANGSITIHNNTTGKAYGMYTSLGGSAINRGNITIDGTTGTSYGIYGEGQNTIENSGTIDVSGKDAYGIYVKDGQGSTVLNTISGIININATNEGHGIYIDENSKDAVVKNEGQIFINNVEKPGDSGITLNGATFENASTVSFSGDANLNSMGGRIVLAKGGVFEAVSLTGDVEAGTSTVMGGNQNTYVSESAFVAEDVSDLNVKSESALFDAKVEKNADGSGYNVTQERKDFAEFTPNASIANYLEANYEDGALEEAFNEVKAQTTEKATAQSFAKKLGYDVMPNFADENFTVMKSLTRNIADNILKPTDEVNRVVAGYDNFSWETDTKGTLSGSDLSANTMYTFGDKRLDNKNRLGLGLSFTQLSTSYDMGGSRDLNIVSIFVPYVHKFTEKLRLATVASIGYGYGDYDRGSYESDINDIFYSLSNELRYTADLNGFAELEPALMLNAIGYSEEGFDEGEGQDALETRRTHNLSVEAGIGLYLKKDFKTEKYGKLGFKVGGAYYHEFGSPYDDITARMKKGNGTWYKMNDYAGVYNRDRAIIEAMVDYEYKRLSLYLKYNRLIQKNNPQLFDLGVKYNF